MHRCFTISKKFGNFNFDSKYLTYSKRNGQLAKIPANAKPYIVIKAAGKSGDLSVTAYVDKKLFGNFALHLFVPKTTMTLLPPN